MALKLGWDVYGWGAMAFVMDVTAFAFPDGEWRLTRGGKTEQKHAQGGDLAGAQEAAEAAFASLLAEDPGVRALLGLDELQARAEAAEIDVRCYRGEALQVRQQLAESEAAVARVMARIAEFEAALRWIPVAERLPTTAVWVARPGGGRIGEALLFERNGRRLWATPGGTHDFVGDERWRPLPAGPENGNG